MCHGQGAAARAAFPDLRRSPLVMDQAAFDSVVLQGTRSSRGMVSFAGRLQPADTEAVRAYLISQAEVARIAPPPGTVQPATQIHQEASDGRAGGESPQRTHK
jgi:mono/diheme cytochrome c family protein